METDEEFARRLQAEFDQEERNVHLQEEEDAALAQQLASQSHELSDSEDEVTLIESPASSRNNSQVASKFEREPKTSTVHTDHMASTSKKNSYKEHSLSDDDDRDSDIDNGKKQDNIKKHKAKQQDNIKKHKDKQHPIPLITNVDHTLSDDDTDDDAIVADETEKLKEILASPKGEVESADVSETAPPSKKRPLCKFGASCYRKNPWHLEEFYHPHLDVDGSKAESAPGGSSEMETPAKRLKSFTNNKSLSEQKENLGKKPFSSRLKASAPYNLFLNKTYSVKGTHDDPLGLVLPDILSPKLGELVESAQLNFMVDLSFVMDNYKACQVDKKPLLVMYGQLDGDPNDYERVKCVKVKIDFQWGTHHTKMMLLQYTNGLRVVIHTANFTSDDWDEKTQGYWVSPLFPELGDDKSSMVDGESPTRFKRDLVEYLLSYKAPDLTRWSNIIKKYDFSSCNMVFIGSSPGYHKDGDKDRWGHMKVRRIMRQHAASWKSSLPIIAQCSSIGSLGKDAKAWLSGELGLSLTGAPGVCASLPAMKVVYPSESDIQNSSQGWMGGSCLPYNSETHAKQEWIMQHFHLWRSEKRRRTRAMPHIKTYTRLSKDNSRAQFLLLTSANLSKAAWGTLQKQNSQLFIRSYEVGVLALPKFVTGESDFELKLPWKEIGFSLPYDVPLTPYPSGAKPWFMNTKKTQPDVLGNTYP